MVYVDAQVMETSTNSPTPEIKRNDSIDTLSLQSEYDVIEMALLEWSSAGCGHLEGVIVASEKHNESASSTTSEMSSVFEDVDTSDEFDFEYSTESTPQSEDQIYVPTSFDKREYEDRFSSAITTDTVRSFLGCWTLTSNEKDLLMDLLPEGLLGNNSS